MPEAAHAEPVGAPHGGAVKRNRSRGVLAACLPLGVIAALLSQALASAAPVVSGPSGAPVAQQSSTPAPASNALADPAAVLGSGYQASHDRAVTVSGDATGLHVLVADESDGYAWRTAATLTVPGTDTTQWIGQACVTGNGQQAVVVYAPRQITNTANAMGDGALASVVDLSTGKVTPVGAGVSIAYFDPGCGTGEQAVLSQGGTGAGVTADQAYDTHLMTLNTVTGKVTADVRVPGEVTSAVPYNGRVAAVSGTGVVSIGPDGGAQVLAHVSGTAFRLSPDASGGLGFLVASGNRVQVRRYAAGANQLVGSAALGSVALTQTGGHVFVTGPHASGVGSVPSGWRPLDVPAGSVISTTGALAVTGATTPVGAKGKFPGAAPPDAAQPTQITGQATATGKAATFSVPATRQPAPAQLPAPLPGFPGSAAPATAAAGKTAATAQTMALADAAVSGTSSHAAMASAPDVSPPPSANPATTTYDPDRSCSVPRNDPNTLTYQASAPEVEWAVDEAVQGKLTNTQPANLYGSGLPSYTPQGLFPPPGLTGGGTIPAPVMLGVLAQESNEDQASPHAIIGQMGNFNPSSNWYGNDGDYTYVNWANSDCGYGIAQITTGMCLFGAPGCSNPLSYENQLAAAVDFQANIAAGVQILEQKYNRLRALNLTTNGGGDPRYVENWWYALWAYNSGMEPNAANGNTAACSPSPTCTDAAGNGMGGHWGLGWVDNPVNPLYPPDRLMFLSTPLVPDGNYNYNWDEAHPQNWSYEEKVIGFAAYGLVAYNYLAKTWEQSFSRTVYPTYDVGGLPVQVDPPQAEPGFGTFCNSTDNCDSSNTTAPCQLTSGADADHCWWNQSVSWVSCSVFCGKQSSILPYSSDPGDPGVPAGYAPACTSSPLPSSAVIVGDTASSIPAPLGCGTSWKTNGGTMTWNFAPDVGKTTTTYPSKIDFHQSGGGYSGHFWFSHTVPSASNDPSSVQPQAGDAQLVDTGTWTPPSSVKGWTRIMAAIPDEGAWDPAANYQISLGNGTTKYSIVNQGDQTDTWVDLGTYNLSAGAKVSLSNVTYLGSGDDIAWDDMAFVPASGESTDYVAMGDSYSSGEGNSPYTKNSSTSIISGVVNQANVCHRSISGGYPTMIKLPGQSQTIAAQAQTETGSTEFRFIACSGAETPNITQLAISPTPSKYDLADNTDWGHGDLGNQGGEDPQDSQGALTGNTTLVTISIGGNDIRFGDVIAGCVITTGTCSAPGFMLKRISNGKTDTVDLKDFEPIVISMLQGHLETVYNRIYALAPNAQIVVLGYPKLFPANPTSSCQVGPGLAGVGAYIGAADQIWLNSMGVLLNTTISQAVTNVRATGVNIRFVNPTSAFSGHELCSSSPWINPISLGIYSGTGGLTFLDPASFHPVLAGQQEFATLINGCLARTVSC